MQQQSFGHDEQAYAQRQAGYSPEPIRDALWARYHDSVRGNVLDAGSGEGGWIKRIKESSSVAKISSVDIVDCGASQISGVEFHRMDLSSDVLPVDDDSLDYVFAIEVAEHLANPRQFISQAFRALKKGGKLVLTTPCNESLRAKVSFVLRGYFPAFCEHDYETSGHITPIFEFDLRRMAKESGFSRADVFFPLSGQLPGMALKWSKVFPGAKSKVFADTLFAEFTK